jgi:hypothetical protein
MLADVGRRVGSDFDAHGEPRGDMRRTGERAIPS